MLAIGTENRAARVPRVSVIIPAFRAAAVIRRAVESVYAQTMQDFEVIVVDDGSPDAAALRRALQGFPRLRYIRRTNGGPAAARNTGLRVARGEFVSFLDADDQWEPRFLAHQLRRLDATDAPDLVYSDASLHGALAAPARSFMSVCPSNGNADFAALVLEQCVVLTSSVVARRSRLVEVGLFDESLRRSEDFDLWLRLARRGARIVYQRLPLARRNVQPDGLSQNGVAMMTDALRALAGAAADPTLDEYDRSLVRLRQVELESHIELHHGKVALRNGDIRGARAHLEAALRFFAATDRKRARKLRFVLAGLRRAPRTVARLAGAYDRWQHRRDHRADTPRELREQTQGA